ncbi:MAG: hypothetical protein ACT4NY_07235 [Pseudonocardiales bacterium]
MEQIVAPRQVGSLQLDQPEARQFRLGLSKLGGRGDAQLIAQDSGSGSR